MVRPTSAGSAAGPSLQAGASVGGATTTGAASATTTAQIASYNLALSLLGTSSSNAVNNIASIVAGGTASCGTSTGSNASSILGLFN